MMKGLKEKGQRATWGVGPSKGSLVFLNGASLCWEKHWRLKEQGFLPGDRGQNGKARCPKLSEYSTQFPLMDENKVKQKL